MWEAKKLGDRQKVIHDRHMGPSVDYPTTLQSPECSFNLAGSILTRPGAKISLGISQSGPSVNYTDLTLGMLTPRGSYDCY